MATQLMLPQYGLRYTRLMVAQGVNDPVLDALERLVSDLRENIDSNTAAIARARTIADMRSRGLPYRQIADETGRPLVVELITENLERLRMSGAELRRAQAEALHDEGLTMGEIAELFGVTRQRVSAILRRGARGG